MSELVSTNWVYKNIENNKLVILDCSWHLTSKKRNALKDYRQSHIKNSIYFNIDKIADKKIESPPYGTTSKVF